MSHIGSEAPLSLLTMKSKEVVPSPGNFKKPDLYSRQRSKRIQHIAKEFWCRWEIRRDFKIGDIVLLTSNTIWNQWPMAKVTDVCKSNDIHVQKVKLRVEDNKFNENCSKYLVRPFTGCSYCSKMMRFNSPTEKQATYIIKMMNRLQGSHVLMVESCEL